MRTWEQVIKALEICDHGEIADQVKMKLLEYFSKVINVCTYVHLTITLAVRWPPVLYTISIISQCLNFVHPSSFNILNQACASQKLVRTYLVEIASVR